MECGRRCVRRRGCEVGRSWFAAGRPGRHSAVRPGEQPVSAAVKSAVYGRPSLRDGDRIVDGLPEPLTTVPASSAERLVLRSVSSTSPTRLEPRTPMCGGGHSRDDDRDARRGTGDGTRVGGRVPGHDAALRRYAERTRAGIVPRTPPRTARRGGYRLFGLFADGTLVALAGISIRMRDRKSVV